MKHFGRLFKKMHFSIRNPFRLKFPKVKLLRLSKRGKFVVSVLLLSAALFFSEFTTGIVVVSLGFVLSLVTVIFLYLILKDDISKKSHFLPILILPFFFTLSFSLFYSLIPARLLTRVLLTGVYAFGAYSLFLTENIFAISSLRTINLLRSARIVSFVITIFVLFFLFNIIFSLRLPLYVTPFLVAAISFLMSAQFLWSYSENRESGREVYIYSSCLSLMMGELAFVLSLWPVTAAIYAIFLTGLFYTYSGLCNAWLERRLFKGILWEYIWVGALSVLFLLVFSKWGA
ncbi:MAG: hypothetical protein KA035_00930 [Candidatus Levybacteria bacterium]|nr:hypothetical protein [Candidatus Levybacteria bacterium]